MEGVIGSRLVVINCPNHHDVLIDGLWKNFVNEIRTDMSMQHDGRSLRAHRMIVEMFLSRTMPTEQDNLAAEASTNGDQDNVTSMLHFMYRGTVAVREDNMENLREMAKNLGFQMMVDAMEAIPGIKPQKVNQPSRTKIKPATNTVPRKRDPPEPRTAKLMISPELYAKTAGMEIAGGEQSENVPVATTLAQIVNDATSGLEIEESTEDQQKSLEPMQVIPGQRKSFSELFPYLKCRYCDYKTKSDMLRRMHEKSKHDGQTPSPFTNISIQANEDGLWPCPLCAKIYTNNSNLRMHLRTHSDRKNFACDVCGYRAHTPGIIRRHRLTHSDTRPHTCDVCGLNYKSLSSFREHMRRHEFGGDNRCHVCDVCGRAFNRRENLKVHLRVHTKERPFKCELCFKAFGTRQTLIFHSKTHTGEHSVRPPKTRRPRPPRVPNNIIVDDVIVEGGGEGVVVGVDDGGEMVLVQPQPPQPPRRKRLPGPRPKRPPNSGEFACTKCQTVLKNHRSLLWHLRQHRLAENPIPATHICVLCEKRFRKHGNLKIHLEKVHGASAIELATL